MIPDIKIGDKVISKAHRPLIIAEMSANHNQSRDRAREIIEMSADAGADFVKLQTYTPDTMTIKGAHKIGDKKSLWYGRELYNLYQEAYTPWEWHQELFDYAKQKGIIAFSTPFDETAVDFLEELQVPAYKIASFENTDWPLLRKVAATGKPVLMSTGVSNLADIDESVRLLKAGGCSEIVLLQCTSTYPASPENSNLLTIPHMESLFHCHVGLSDHTFGIGASVASVALGARVIEKHVTLSREDGGVDSAFSMEPGELKSLVTETKRAFEALGEIRYGVLAEEEKSLLYKRSVFAVKDIDQGQELNTDNIRVIRPGTGLHPKYYDQILGKQTKNSVKAGTPLTWDILI